MEHPAGDRSVGIAGPDHGCTAFRPLVYHSTWTLGVGHQGQAIRGMSDGWIEVGIAVAIGLPLGVLVGTIYWPERIPKGRSVEDIKRRVEEERRRTR